MLSGSHALNQAIIDEGKVTQARNLSAQAVDELRLGQYIKAINYYTSALSALKDPIAHSRISAIEMESDVKAGLARVYLTTGNNHVNAGRLQSAQTDYNKGLEALGVNAFFVDGSFPHQVQSELTQNIKIVCTKIEVDNIFSQAEQAFRVGNLADALSKCDQALRKDAGNLNVKHLKAFVLMQDGCHALYDLQNFETATSCLEKSTSLFQEVFRASLDAKVKHDLFNAQLNLAKAYTASDNIQKAITVCNAILGDDRHRSNAVEHNTKDLKIKLLAHQSFGAENSTIGLATISEIHQLASTPELQAVASKFITVIDNVWNLYDKGSRLLSDGKLDEALTQFQVVLSIQSHAQSIKSVDLICKKYYENGNQCVVSSDFNSAIQLYIKCINIKPSDSHYRVKMAEALSKGRSIEFILFAKQAIELGVTGDDLRITHELFQNGAERLGKDLIPLIGSINNTALDQESGKMFMTKVPEEQISTLNEILSRMQECLNFWPDVNVSDSGVTKAALLSVMMNAYNLLGIHALQKEDFNGADNYYNKSIELAASCENPSLVNVFIGNKHELAGVRLEKAGDFAGAVREYNKALEFNPEDTETRERIKKILTDHPELSSARSTADSAAHVDEAALGSAVEGMQLSGEDGITHSSHSE